jgi:Ca2+/H+ antiporter, TMEM165/GDT1 family
MNKKFWLKKIMGFAVLGIICVSLLGYAIMFLWNSILVPVLSISQISFWQALGIFALSKILFGGMGTSFGHRKNGYWKNEMKEKWGGMSPEEREKIKQEWRNRCRVWKKEDFPSE